MDLLNDKGIFAYIYISRMYISPVVPSRSILLEFLQLCCTYRVGFANLSLTARKTCLSVSQFGSLDPKTSRLPLFALLLFTHGVPTTTTAPMLALRTVSAPIRHHNWVPSLLDSLCWFVSYGISISVSEAIQHQDQHQDQDQDQDQYSNHTPGRLYSETAATQSRTE